MKMHGSRRSMGFRPFAGSLVLALLAVSACGSESMLETRPSADVDESEASLHRAALQEIRDIENRRLLGNARLRRYLRSPVAAEAEAAHVAAGRIGDTGLTDDVARGLDRESARVRAAAAFALGLLGGDTALGALRAHFDGEARPSVKAALALALGRTGLEEDVPRLAAALSVADAVAVNGASAEGLGTLLRRAPNAIVVAPEAIARLVELTSLAPDERATPAAFALVSIRGTGTLFSEGPVVAAFRAASSPSTRAYLARILRRIATPAATSALFAALTTDEAIIARAEFARQVGLLPATADTLAALDKALDDPAAQVVVAAIQSSAVLGANAASLAPRLAALVDGATSPWIRTEALTALVATDPALARPRVSAALLGTDRRFKVAAIGGLGALGTDADLVALDGLLADPDLRNVSAVIDAIATFDAARIPAGTVDKIRVALSSRDLAVVVSTATAAAAHGWTTFAGELAAIYDASPGGAFIEGRMAILAALGQLGNTAVLPTVTRALDDPERVVVAAAADAYLALTGIDVRARIPLASRVTDDTPSPGAVARALRARVLLQTSRGRIVMRMNPEAPLTATNFVRLVERGFYDGLDFHRVVPDFVAQGGDPRGDGYGGLNELVREEIGALHDRGTVGMATAGKDTASCQFFFNHGWNVHLDSAYTVFAHVVSGMNVVDRLEIGDVIEAAYAF
jgi:cyclophilin family peptidyl-prolyl cis-trans isomerase